MPLMSQASKRGGWLLSTFYRKHYLPPLSYRNQIPTTAPRSWLRAWDSHPRSTQDLSSVYHADFLFLFGASKIFILFLSLALPFCSLSILCQSLSWIWNRGETLKFEQTVLTWLESISWLLNWLLTTEVFYCTRHCWLFTLPGNQHSSDSLPNSDLFLDPLLLTFSPPLFACNISFLQDLINPLLLPSSYTLYQHPRFLPLWNPSISASWPRCSSQPSIMGSGTTSSTQPSPNRIIILDHGLPYHPHVINYWVLNLCLRNPLCNCLGSDALINSWTIVKSINGELRMHLLPALSHLPKWHQNNSEKCTSSWAWKKPHDLKHVHLSSLESTILCQTTCSSQMYLVLHVSAFLVFNHIS